MTAPTASGNPQWPRAGVSMAVFRQRRVLLIERGKGSYKGLWTLPGGHIEPGETARAAALREVAEETGIKARIDGVADVHDVIIRTAHGVLEAHYMLAIFHGRWLAGEPSPCSDAAAARFVAREELGALALTPGALAILDKAWRLDDAMTVGP